MVVKIRFMRVGRKNRPYYRLGVSDGRFNRDGKCLEIIGNFDPLCKDEAKKFNVDGERIKHWLSVGAKPSPTVVTLLKEKGMWTVAPKKKRDRSGRTKARAAKFKRLNAARKTAAKKK